jgi:hypothetical protein
VSGEAKSAVDFLGAHENSAGLRQWMDALPGDKTVLPSDDRHYLEFMEAGVALQFDSESSILETILLYTEGHDEYSGYQGELPNGIDFGHSRNEVRKRLGKPEKSGAADKRDQTPAWDRYNFGTYGLHVQYSEDEQSIDLLTLMTPEAMP